MFSGNSDKKRSGTDGNMPSILSKGLVITGDLATDGEIQIDGLVTGNIRAESLTVGKSSHITGDIDAENITIHGKVDGNINGGDVIIGETASLRGDVTNRSLTIEPGAKIDGHCRHSDSPRNNSDLVINFADSSESAVK